MAITKNSLQTDFSFSPSFSKIIKQATSNDFIIIDDVLTGQRVVSSQPIRWVRITESGSVSEMSDAPTGVTAFSPSHSSWSSSAIYVKDNKVVVIRYPSTPITDFTNSQEVTEYAIGSSDVLYLKIDHSTNTVTAYQP
jgi:hypothetical protein